MVVTDVPFPAAALAGISGWVWVAGEELLGGCCRNENLVVQREWEHGQRAGQVSPGKSLGEGWTRVRPRTFPACSHRLSQDVAALPCAEQGR